MPCRVTFDIDRKTMKYAERTAKSLHMNTKALIIKALVLYAREHKRVKRSRRLKERARWLDRHFTEVRA